MLTEEEKAKKKEASDIRIKRRQRLALLFLATFFFLVFFSKYLWGPIGVNISYSEGERNVKIVKITSKGLIWRTWEIAGLIVANGPGYFNTYIWDFSIDNEDPNKDKKLEIIKDAFETGAIVKVTYDQRAGFVPWRSDTTYLVKDVVYTGHGTNNASNSHK